ncbi:MAG: hypothetical protein AB1798_21850, partial [Spirochaetota bacterium]
VVDLKLILYLLAKNNPGYFYLGSINREGETDPVVLEHFHIVVLFPYFTPDGEFHTAVMERNTETSVESLTKRYPADFIHLVRLEAVSGYNPPYIE